MFWVKTIYQAPYYEKNIGLLNINKKRIFKFKKLIFEVKK